MPVKMHSKVNYKEITVLQIIVSIIINFSIILDCIQVCENQLVYYRNSLQGKPHQRLTLRTFQWI